MVSDPAKHGLVVFAREVDRYVKQYEEAVKYLVSTELGFNNEGN